jgi:Ca2+-binding RTX toxin-like protein
MAFFLRQKQRNHLFIIGVILVLFGARLTAQESIAIIPADTTYLYYFESDDARLVEQNYKEYAFATLPNEKVTIVVYGLDKRIQPKLTLLDRDREFIREGIRPKELPAIGGEPNATPEELASISYIEFISTSVELYFFRVDRMNEQGGLARVMLLQGDPLDTDLTILDTLNPLLPNRAFMVAGKSDEEGLRTLVEVLDVPYYNQKPEVFVGRGRLDNLPPLEQRTQPIEQRDWFNKDGQKVYLYTISPRPEDIIDPTQTRPEFTTLNVGGFFYFDYYFSVGEGGIPQSFANFQECASATNRVNCVNNSPLFGRTEQEASGIPLIIPDTLGLADLPPIQDCVGGVGLVIVLPNTTVPPGKLAGSTCDDTLIGSPVADGIRGGAGNDILYGMGGDDILFGEDGNDMLSGGLGNDTIDGGLGSDTVSYLYEDYMAFTTNSTAVNINLAGGFATGLGVDVLIGIENAQGGEGDDTLTGDSNINLLEGASGNDILNGGGGADFLFGDAGDDSYILNSAQDNTYISDTFGNDTVEVRNTASGTVYYYDADGGNLFDFSGISTAVTFDGSNTSAQTIFTGLNIAPVFGANGIIGTTQNDTLTGANIANNCDEIDAGDGDDTIYATRSNDCTGGRTADNINAGNGNDWVSYNNLSSYSANSYILYPSYYIGSKLYYYTAGQNITDISGVNANLTTGNGTKNTQTCNTEYRYWYDTSVFIFGFDFVSSCAPAPSVGNDTLTDVENLVGTFSNDTLIGNDAPNQLYGQSGADSIDGGEADDTLRGGFGYDTLIGGNGTDVADYSINASYSDIVGATVYLDGAAGGSDSLVGVENVIATTGGDFVRGNDGDNSIQMGDGNDYYQTRGSNAIFGNDTLESGAGRDTLDTATLSGNATLTVNVSSGQYSQLLGTVDFIDTEAFIMGSGNDSIQINNSFGNTTNFMSLNTGAGNNTINFAIGAIGYVEITPTAQDQISVDNATPPLGFDGTNIIDWQEIATNLFIRITAIINATCRGAGITNPITGTAGVENYGTETTPLTTCASNERFDGRGGSDTITYAPVTVGVTFNLGDGGVANVRGTATGTGLGTDTLIDIESIIGSTNADTFIFTPYTAGLATYTLNGGGGADTLNFSGISTPINIDLLLGTAQTVYTNLSLTLGSTNFNTIIGGSGNDTLLTNNNNDTITGGAGNDSITARGGNDTVDAGIGNDIVIGGIGNDSITGGDGNDEVYAGDNNDIIIDDGATGGADILYGENGNDSIRVGLDGAGDEISGGAGNDTITYNTTGNIVATFAGTNNITDGVGIDTLFADGLDVFNSGSGNDTFTVSNNDFVTINFNDGNDSLALADVAGNQTYDGGVGIDSLRFSSGTAKNITITNATSTLTPASDTFNNFEVFLFNNGADTINVSNDAGITSINTGNGNDTITVATNNAANTFIGGTVGTQVLTYSAAGGQTVNVGSGTNTAGADTFSNFETLNLGNGNDAITIDGATDVPNILAAGGDDTLVVTNDTLAFSVNLGTGANTFDIQSVTGAANTFTGSGADTIVYNVANNLTVTLSGAPQTISGGGGVDTVSGMATVGTGSGADTITLGTTALVTTINSGAGNDSFNIALNGGNNTLDGEGDTDTANYTDNVAFTIISGASTTVNDGAFTDTLNNFEALVTNNSADTITVGDGSGLTSISTNGGVDSLTFTTTTAVTATLGATDTAGAILLNNVDVLGLTTLGDTASIANGTGVDTLNMGDGDDTLTYNGTTATTAVDTGAGADSLTISNTSATSVINAGADNDTITVVNANAGATINGNAGNDTFVITANATNNTFNGGADSDTADYSANASNFTVSFGATDTIAGGGGTDTLTNFEQVNTGSGNDTINFNLTTMGGGTVVVNAGGGAIGNLFNFSGTPATATVVEIYTSGGADSIDFSGMGVAVTFDASNTATSQSVATNLTVWIHNVIANIVGTPLADQIVGTVGNDNIDGGAGNDTLVGGAGNDTLTGGANADTLIGGDRVICTTAGCTASTGAGGDDSILGGAGDDTIIGGNVADCSAQAGSTGVTAADNTGVDTIDGGTGSDVVYGDNQVTNCTTMTNGAGGNDVIDGGDNDDTLYGGNNNTSATTGGNDGSDTITGGNGADTVYGGNNNTNATLGGNDGNDSIEVTGGGNDNVWGGNNNTGATTPGTDPGVNTINASGGDTSTQGNNP